MTALLEKRIKSWLEQLKKGYFIPTPQKDTHYGDSKFLYIHDCQNFPVEFIVKGAIDDSDFSPWSEAEDELRANKKNALLYNGGVGETLNLIKPYLVDFKTVWFLDNYLNFDTAKVKQYRDNLYLLKSLN